MFDLTPFEPGTTISPYTLELEFERALSDSSIALREVYELWRDFFSDNQGTYVRIAGYPLHWELFVKATWKLFLSLPEEEVFVHVRWQLPTAFRLGVHVEDQLFFYLYRRYPQEREIEAAYRSIRQTVLQSNVPLNPAAKGSISIRDVAEQKKGAYKKDVAIDDSATLARIEYELFPTTSERSKNTEEAEKIATTRAFLGFINFFRDTDVILPVLTEYVIRLMEPATAPEPVAGKKATKKTDQSIRLKDTAVIPQMPPVIIPPDEENADEQERDSRMNHREIQALIDHRFGKDEIGAYRNIEGVLATLESFAQKYNDETITELLYFDEDRGVFAWNEELLNS